MLTGSENCKSEWKITVGLLFVQVSFGKRNWSQSGGGFNVLWTICTQKRVENRKTRTLWCAVLCFVFFCGEALTCTSHQGDSKLAYRSVSCFLLRTDGDAAHCATSLPGKLLKTAGPGLHREYRLLWWDLHNKQKTGHDRSFVRTSQTCEVMQLLRGAPWALFGWAGHRRTFQSGCVVTFPGRAFSGIFLFNDHKIPC